MATKGGVSEREYMSPFKGKEVALATPLKATSEELTTMTIAANARKLNICLELM